MSKRLVIDASLAFRLILPGREQESLRELVARWLHDGCALYAPSLWLYEITSALCKTVRFGELTADEGERALALAQALGVCLIPPDDVQARSAFDWTLRLGRSAAYDSFYLALAEQMQCEMWTVDQRLHNAANQPWVCLAGPV